MLQPHLDYNALVLGGCVVGVGRVKGRPLSWDFKIANFFVTGLNKLKC